MAKIQVNDRWRIASCTHGWGLQKAKKGKNKDTGAPETVWGRELFYTTSTFDEAVTQLAKVLLRESSATDIGQLTRDAREITELLEELRKVDKPAA